MKGCKKHDSRQVSWCAVVSMHIAYFRIDNDDGGGEDQREAGRWKAEAT